MSLLLSEEKTIRARVTRRRLKYLSGRTLTYLIVIAGALLLIYPLIWMVLSSFKPEDTIFGNSNLWPTTWIWTNYSEGWNALNDPFTLYFTNSLIVCIMAIVGNVISCSLAAYAFARLKFRFKRVWFVIMQGAILLPMHVIIVPQFILYKNLGWLDTLLPLWVPKFFAVDAFFIFLMIQFMRSIPMELDEAAKIDGCSHLQFFLRVMIPLSLPALVTTAIFTFIWTWSDFFAPVIYLQSESNYTMPLALSSFIDSTGNSAYGQLFAMSVLSLVPVFAFFLIFQRLLIEGASNSGIKG